MVSPVQKNADSGVYTCWARNKQGHSARRSGEVTVIGNVIYASKFLKENTIYYSNHSTNEKNTFNNLLNYQ